MGIKVWFFGQLQDDVGASELPFEMDAPGMTVAEIWAGLSHRFHFSVPQARVRPALNDEFCSWDSPCVPGDSLGFMPPVSGG